MHLDTVAKYIRRSPYQSIAATLVMTVTFFAISVFALLTIISAGVIDYFESAPQLRIFFKQTATEPQIKELQAKIDSTGRASKVTYVSQAEALKIYHDLTEQDPVLLELVTADILPASLEVQTENPQDLSEIAGALQGVTIIEQVQLPQDVIDTILSWTEGARRLGIGVIAVLLIVSMFVIVTIVGIKITVRREEIEIMRLIGASNWFIRLPFLLEGMLYGFIGALAGWTIAVGLLLYETPGLKEKLGDIHVLPLSPIVMTELLVAELIFAIFLGAIASYLAVLRYLK